MTVSTDHAERFMETGRWAMVRTNGREVERVTGYSLRTLLLMQERDRWAGTTSTIVPDVPRKSGRVDLSNVRGR